MNNASSLNSFQYSVNFNDLNFISSILPSVDLDSEITRPTSADQTFFNSTFNTVLAPELSSAGIVLYKQPIDYRPVEFLQEDSAAALFLQQQQQQNVRPALNFNLHDFNNSSLTGLGGSDQLQIEMPRTAQPIEEGSLTTTVSARKGLIPKVSSSSTWSTLKTSGSSSSGPTTKSASSKGPPPPPPKSQCKNPTPQQPSTSSGLLVPPILLQQPFSIGLGGKSPRNLQSMATTAKDSRPATRLHAKNVAATTATEVAQHLKRLSRSSMQKTTSVDDDDNEFESDGEGSNVEFVGMEQGREPTVPSRSAGANNPLTSSIRRTSSSTSSSSVTRAKSGLTTPEAIQKLKLAETSRLQSIVRDKVAQGHPEPALGMSSFITLTSPMAAVPTLTASESGAQGLGISMGGLAYDDSWSIPSLPVGYSGGGGLFTYSPSITSTPLSTSIPSVLLAPGSGFGFMPQVPMAQMPPYQPNYTTSPYVPSLAHSAIGFSSPSTMDSHNSIADWPLSSPLPFKPPSSKGYQGYHTIDMGAYSACWRVWDKRENRFVCLKFYFDSTLSLLSDRLIKFASASDHRQQHEAEMYKMLKSDCDFIVRYFGAGEDEEQAQQLQIDSCVNGYYIDLEYLATNLEDCVLRREMLDPDVIRKVLYSLLSACGYLAHRKIIHNDLRPASVGWTQTGRLKIFDFGSACLESEAKVFGMYGELSGQAPELFRGVKASQMSQVWQIGAIIIFAASAHMIYPPHPDAASHKGLPLLTRKGLELKHYERAAASFEDYVLRTGEVSMARYFTHAYQSDLVIARNLLQPQMTLRKSAADALEEMKTRKFSKSVVFDQGILVKGPGEQVPPSVAKDVIIEHTKGADLDRKLIINDHDRKIKRLEEKNDLLARRLRRAERHSASSSSSSRRGEKRTRDDDKSDASKEEPAIQQELDRTHLELFRLQALVATSGEASYDELVARLNVQREAIEKMNGFVVLSNERVRAMTTICSLVLLAFRSSPEAALQVATNWDAARAGWELDSPKVAKAREHSGVGEKIRDILIKLASENTLNLETLEIFKAFLTDYENMSKLAGAAMDFDYRKLETLLSLTMARKFPQNAATTEKRAAKSSSGSTSSSQSEDGHAPPMTMQAIFAASDENAAQALQLNTPMASVGRPQLTNIMRVMNPMGCSLSNETLSMILDTASGLGSSTSACSALDLQSTQTSSLKQRTEPYLEPTSTNLAMDFATPAAHPKSRHASTNEPRSELDRSHYERYSNLRKKMRPTIDAYRGTEEFQQLARSSSNSEYGPEKTWDSPDYVPSIKAPRTGNQSATSVDDSTVRDSAVLVELPKTPTDLLGGELSVTVTSALTIRAPSIEEDQMDVNPPSEEELMAVLQDPLVLEAQHRAAISPPNDLALVTRPTVLETRMISENIPDPFANTNVGIDENVPGAFSVGMKEDEPTSTGSTPTQDDETSLPYEQTSTFDLVNTNPATPPPPFNLDQGSQCSNMSAFSETAMDVESESVPTLTSLAVPCTTSSRTTILFKSQADGTFRVMDNEQTQPSTESGATNEFDKENQMISDSGNDSVFGQLAGVLPVGSDDGEARLEEGEIVGADSESEGGDGFTKRKIRRKPSESMQTITMVAQSSIETTTTPTIETTTTTATMETTTIPIIITTTTTTTPTITTTPLLSETTAATVSMATTTEATYSDNLDNGVVQAIIDPGLSEMGGATGFSWGKHAVGLLPFEDDEDVISIASDSNDEDDDNKAAAESNVTTIIKSKQAPFRTNNTDDNDARLNKPSTSILQHPTGQLPTMTNVSSIDEKPAEDQYGDSDTEAGSLAAPSIKRSVLISTADNVLVRKGFHEPLIAKAIKAEKEGQILTEAYAVAARIIVHHNQKLPPAETRDLLSIIVPTPPLLTVPEHTVLTPFAKHQDKESFKLFSKFVRIAAPQAVNLRLKIPISLLTYNWISTALDHVIALEDIRRSQNVQQLFPFEGRLAKADIPNFLICADYCYRICTHPDFYESAGPDPETIRELVQMPLEAEAIIDYVKGSHGHPSTNIHVLFLDYVNYSWSHNMTYVNSAWRVLCRAIGEESYIGQDRYVAHSRLKTLIGRCQLFHQLGPGAQLQVPADKPSVAFKRIRQAHGLRKNEAKELDAMF